MLRLSLWMIIWFLKLTSVNILAETTLNLVKLDKSYYCTLTNDTQDSAILWGTQTTETYPSSTIYCDIKSNSTCPLHRNTVWRLRQAMEFSPILDHRWENIAGKNISFLSTISVYEPQKENFRISFSFRGKEVHILLCDRAFNGTYGNCYWIGIDANNGAKHYLRKCKESQIPTKMWEYDTQCMKDEIISDTTEKLLDKYQWNHFSVSKKNNNITVSYFNITNQQLKEILKFPDHTNAFDIKHVIVRTEGNDTGYMKIHKVNTLYTTHAGVAKITISSTLKPTCLSVYVRTCRTCALHAWISNKTGNVIKEETVKNAQNWRRIVLKSNSGISDISVRAERNITGNNLFWYVSSTIQQCEGVIPTKKGDKGCCFALKYPHLNICAKDFMTYKFEDTDFECPSNTIGRNCLLCNLFGRSDCAKSKLCYTTSKGDILCSCAAGYKSTLQSNCLDKCSPGTYGHNCRKQCGKCMEKACNHIDGNCSNCQTNFDGKTCHEPILPIVKEAPKIENAEYRQITIKISLEYDGREKPMYYQIQYKNDQDSRWSNSTKLISIITFSPSGTQQIDNLKPNTNYTVRVLLYASDQRVYDGNYVPISRSQTRCADLDQGYLHQIVTGKSITVSVVHANDEICYPLSQFELCINGNWPRCQVIENTVTFDYLDYYVNYTLTLRKNKADMKTWTIQTHEGPPERVQYIHANTNNTIAELTWDAPAKTNGKIRGYQVQYHRTSSKACFPTEQREYQSNTVNVTNNSVLLNFLAPYSNYEGHIRAFTSHEGTRQPFRFETMETKVPTEPEFPISTHYQTKKLNVNLHWNCSTLEGPINFYMNLTCKSSWCTDDIVQTSRTFPFFRLLSYEFSIIGYTDYTLTLSLSRNHAEITKDIHIRTLPTEPGIVRNVTIYTKNGTSVALRWLPPYPPTGEIEYYMIKYHDSAYKYATVNITSECKVWRGQICYTLTDLRSPKIYINVWARNINVSQNGAESHPLSTETKEEVSESPKNISLEWDDGYNLTVRWEHPDRTNGQLRQFQIYVNGKQSLYNVNDEKLNYEQKVNVEILNLTSQQLNVEVKAKNSAGTSEAINRSIYSPPRTSKLAQDLSTKDVTNNTFTIEIPEILNVEGNTSVMYIVISDTNDDKIVERKDIHSSEKKLLDEISVEPNKSWVVGIFNLYNVTHRQGFHFEVGDDSETLSETDTTWKLKNRKLHTGRTYNISIVLNNTFMEFSRLNTYTILQTTEAPKPPEGLKYLLILLLIPVVLCILCVLLIRRNREKVASSIYVSLQQFGLSRNTGEVPLRPLIRENNTPTPQSSITKSIAASSKKGDERTMAEEVQYTKPVKITDLNEYIKESIENGEFERQHGLFQRGQTKPWIHGTKQQNKSKNRYTNLAAYDHTRVKLEIINKDPYSDYINANYIDGYKTKRAYIATQGPKAGTLNDFWRMIWQEKVEYVVMIANIIEAGKKKVEKYWPEINDSKEFNNIKVEYISVDVMANYEIRYFNVSCNGEERKIQQLHFLTWPDHGVPLYAQSLSPFLKKMLTIPHGRVPIVVHCSAGVGRTGSLILCDICLRMAAREGKIDALYYLHKIRDERVNMVDNVEQYKLVHLVLLQCLVAPDTGIVCNESMEKTIEIITTTKIEEEMNYLDESAWQDDAMRNTNINSDLPIIQNKNRFKNILPDAASRISLSPYPSSDPSSSYINAVVVDAFTVPSKFIVTQDPLSSTVGDFWRLIEEKEVTMIICLNELDLQEKTTCKFYPTSNGQSMKPVQYLEIKFNRKEVNPHFKVYSVTMNRLDNEEDNIHIKILHLNKWDSKALHPKNPIGLLMAYEEMNRLGRTSDTIVITCHNGAKACGLYVAMCFVIDKIKMEQICDVCLAVRTVRHGRKEFVRKAEQYTFLYHCALEYIRQFEMYSNFSSGRMTK